MATESKAATRPRSKAASKQAPWWQECAPEVGEITRFAFGPSHTFIARLENEWQLLAQPAVPEPPQEVRAAVTQPKSMPKEQSGLQRFVFKKTEPRLTVTPALADRPVVARPAAALSIPPGVSVCLYISSPLWLRIDVHKKGTTLAEVPIFRPSDIWFGPSTLEGALCYSSRTHAHLDVANLPHRNHRAITPVVIRNEDDETFRFERLSLPVPYLTMFATESGEIWTDTVTLVRNKDGETGSLDISGKIPPEAGSGAKLRGPREKRPSSSLISTIGEWLG